jgi:hypothetical protein
MKKQLFFIAMLAIIGLSANAQWQQTSLDSGRVNCFAVKGNNIFAGADLASSGSGVFLSTNSGNSWTMVNNGLNSGYGVTTLVIKGDTIFAGTDGGGISFSSNNGNNWTSTNFPDSIEVKDLAISGNKIFAAGDLGVYLSTNDGSNWLKVNTGLPNDFYNAIIAKGDTIFVGSENNGVYMSSNYGSNWTTTGLTGTGAAVNAFAIGGNNIFVSIDWGGVYLSSNNGALWTADTNGLPFGIGNYGFTALAANNSDVFVGTAGSGTSSLGVLLSTNNESNWFQEGLTGINVWSLAIIGDTLFAGTSIQGGVWKRALSEMTSIKEINNNAGNIAVYPNPNNGIFQVSGFQYPASSIEIYNVLGEKIYNSLITDNRSQITINIANLPSGVYVVEVRTVNGIAVKKFVKE